MAASRDCQSANGSRWRRLLEGGGVGLTVAALLLTTSGMTPMGWDEGDSIVRAEQVPHAWPYTTQREGHPALYGIIIALGETLSSRWLDPLTAARCGPIVLFALALAAMYVRLAAEYSYAAGLGGVMACLLMPRLFAHAHFASFDGPLTSCWLLAWALWPSRHYRRGSANECAAEKGARRPVASLLWGAVLGAAFSCKATGWLAAVPFAVWVMIYPSRAAWRTLTIGLLTALAVFWLMNPPLWHDPAQGWLTFFRLNVHRAADPGLNISTQFFGRLYNLDCSLPWYNTLLWTLVTVPLGILFLAGCGLAAILYRRRGDPVGILLVANWLVLLVVRALPGTPPHDAERLILPSFALLGALAGVGSHWLLRGHRMKNAKCKMQNANGGSEPMAGPHGHSNSWYRFALLGFVYLGSATSLFWYAPQWLCYYNLLIGGLPGAVTLGMEPTYYWDGLDGSVLDWLNRHTGPNEKVRFAAAPDDNLVLLRRWGKLQPETLPEAPGQFTWYVLQRRPSGMQPVDNWLVAQAVPVYEKRIRPGGWGPWRLDVPIVQVFRGQDAERDLGVSGPNL